MHEKKNYTYSSWFNNFFINKNIKFVLITDKNNKKAQSNEVYIFKKNATQFSILVKIYY